MTKKEQNGYYISHERFEDIIQVINSTVTIEELLETLTTATTISRACYFNFSTVGAFDFRGLSQYHAYNMPMTITNYIDTHNSHKPDLVIQTVFSKGQFMWLSDLKRDPAIIDTVFFSLLEALFSITKDSLFIPLYGPNNRSGFLFLTYEWKKDECSNVFGHQIQALAQTFHVRYCLMQEKLSKTVKLTARESQVLELICFGKTNAEIGKKLQISPNTVASYVKQIFLKLEVSDRVSAAMRAQTLKVDI